MKLVLLRNMDHNEYSSISGFVKLNFKNHFLLMFIEKAELEISTFHVKDWQYFMDIGQDVTKIGFPLLFWLFVNPVCFNMDFLKILRVEYTEDSQISSSVVHL